MTPFARLAAALELLEGLESRPQPADAALAAWFRTRRFAGAKDRAAVAERVYGIIRRRARLDRHLARVGLPATPRSRLIADVVLGDGVGAGKLEYLFMGGERAPARLTMDELRAARGLQGGNLDDPSMPELVRLECPDWAEAPLRASLGDRFADEMRALMVEAPVDIRVNALKAERETVAELLAAQGVEATPTPWSPWGLRMTKRAALSATQAFRDGLFEFQDEGSQLLALLVAPRPGMQVVDFCAGAGGKTLALAAMMANKGRIVACDVLAERIERAGLRFRRAGIHNIERRPLSSERDKWVKRAAGTFDRVLVDAPCSGVGAWRRNPDARWNRLAPELDRLTALQAAILDSASRLVKPGGRLIYATCSMLACENREQVDRFLAARPEFRLLPAGEVLAEVLPVVPAELAGETMDLTPLRHGTDGFFGAVMERVPQAA